MTLTFCMDLTLVIGNNSLKFHDDPMMGTYSKRCDGQTDGQTDRQTENTICRAAWSQLKMALVLNKQIFLTSNQATYIAHVLICNQNVRHSQHVPWVYITWSHEFVADSNDVSPRFACVLLLFVVIFILNDMCTLQLQDYPIQTSKFASMSNVWDGSFIYCLPEDPITQIVGVYLGHNWETVLF